MYVCMHACMHACMHVYTHTYIHIIIILIYTYKSFKIEIFPPAHAALKRELYLNSHLKGTSHSYRRLIFTKIHLYYFIYIFGHVPDV